MIRPRWILAAFALAAFGGGQAVAAPAKKAAVQRDWTRVVAATPEGGYRVGNPAAKVKVIEYGSLTCPHCAHFAEEGYPKLLNTYVKSGKVSFEFRNYVRDMYDMAGALVSRCAGAANYFALTDALFRTLPEWRARINGLSPDERARLISLPPAEGNPQIAKAAGFIDMAANYGVTPAKANQCLADPARLGQLLDMKRVANDRIGLEYTPTFLINGQKVAADGLETLEPLLKGAGG